jgi:hypothetical protein
MRLAQECGNGSAVHEFCERVFPLLAELSRYAGENPEEVVEVPVEVVPSLLVIPKVEVAPVELPVPKIIEE